MALQETPFDFHSFNHYNNDVVLRHQKYISRCNDDVVAMTLAYFFKKYSGKKSLHFINAIRSQMFAASKNTIE